MILEGISVDTLVPVSDLKGGFNPVPRGLRVVRLDEKDNGCPGISPGVRLGAGTGGNSLGVFRMEVSPESHLTTFYTQTGCGGMGRKTGAHDDEHHTVKEGAMDSEEGGGEGHLHTEVGGVQQSSTGLAAVRRMGWTERMVE